MHKLKKETGASLVEILICMALVGIIAMTILPSITFGYLQLTESGNRTKAIYAVRQMTENELVNHSASGHDTLSITFGSGSNRVSIDVKGRIVESEEPFGTKGDKARLRVFIPDK